MNCQTCRERMTELADARLDAETAAAVAGPHRRLPEACRSEFDTFSRHARCARRHPLRPAAHRMRAQVMGPIETEKLTQRNQAALGVVHPLGRGRAPPPHSVGPFVLQASGRARSSPWASSSASAPRPSARSPTFAPGSTPWASWSSSPSFRSARPGDRLETVLTAATTSKPDERVIDGLINSMAFDPSVNVRLNALSALYAHADQEVVRAGVLACLPRETNPLVQVSMIDFLVATKAREASPELRRLASDAKANADVRDSARRAIDLL